MQNIVLMSVNSTLLSGTSKNILCRSQLKHGLWIFNKLKTINVNDLFNLRMFMLDHPTVYECISVRSVPAGNTVV